MAGRREGETWYSKEHGSYYFFRQGIREPQIVFMADEVALLYDAREGTLFKHGSPEAVEAARRKFEGAAGDWVLRVISSREWDVVELNRIVATAGAVREFLARLPGGEALMESAIGEDRSAPRVLKP